MSFLLAIPLWAFLAGPAPTPPETLTLRDGRVFTVKEPPITRDGRVIFTTTEGKTYSLDAADVKSFVASPPTPTQAPHAYNPQDSRALGAIARQQRSETGKTTELSAPRPTRRNTAKPTRTARPTPARTPAPHSAPAPTAPPPTAAPH